jgi:Putative peptidoglycan binding domain
VDLGDESSISQAFLVRGSGIKTGSGRSYLKNGKMFMNYKKLIAVTITLIVCALTGSNVMGHGGGGFGGSGFGGGGGFRGGFGGSTFHGGGAFGRGGFNGRGFSGGFSNGRFRGGFRGEAFAVIGSTIATSTIGSSSLAILAPRSFTIPMPITDTIPDIILTITDTILTINLFTKAALDTLTLWLGKSSSVWLVPGYYHGAIDGVSGTATRRAIRQYERAHGLPADGQIGGRLVTTMGLT